MPPRASVVLILFIFGLLSFHGQPARAAGNLRWGPFKINPSIGLTEMLDSNVCRTDSGDCVVDGKNDDGQDSVTLISPGLLVVLPLRKNDVELEYKGEIARYGTLSSEDYEDHAIRGAVHFNSPMGFKASAEDRFRHAHDPRGESQNTDLDLFKENTASVVLGQVLGGRFSVEGTGRFMTIDYDASRNDFRDRKEATGGATAFYRVQPKTSALLEFLWKDVSYDKNLEPESRDSTVVDVLTGMIYEISAKSKGTLKAGVETKTFKDSGRTNYTGLAVSMEVEHQLTPKTALKGLVERTSRESSVSTQDYSILTGGGISLSHRFTAKITGTGRFSFGREDYPNDQTVDSKTDKRVDNTVLGGLGVVYWIQQWLNVGANIDLEQRNSSFNTYDYSDQRYSMTVALVL